MGDPRERPWQDAYAEKLEAELDVWRRHGVLVTEDCGECGGTGHRPGTSPTGLHEHDEWCRCHVCDGSGKVLKDGARYFGNRKTMCFPASWLEGASDE